DIPPAPRHVPQVEVAFDIDANGIVQVSAKDLATGKEQAMTITGGTALGKDEIESMVKDAEKFAEEDHQRREAAETRNQADNLVYSVEKALGEYGDKVPADDREAVEKAAEEVKEALKGEDLDVIKSSTESLMKAFEKVGADMYAQAQAAESTGADGAPEQESEDDVVEGEIVDEGEAS
ncbi:MAG: Hsp70 family protein, partial [Actinobacteria bacterium]|nr:Hsp70 family protein [Actinomycetota bacterium]